MVKKPEEKITLKQARQWVGLTQQEVADKLGVHVTTYLKWEKDPAEMKVSTARAVCKVVGRQWDEIFFEKKSNLIRQNNTA